MCIVYLSVWCAHKYPILSVNNLGFKLVHANNYVLHNKKISKDMCITFWLIKFTPVCIHTHTMHVLCWLFAPYAYGTVHMHIGQKYAHTTHMKQLIHLWTAYMGTVRPWLSESWSFEPSDSSNDRVFCQQVYVFIRVVFVLSHITCNRICSISTNLK